MGVKLLNHSISRFIINRIGFSGTLLSLPPPALGIVQILEFNDSSENCVKGEGVNHLGDFIVPIKYSEFLFGEEGPRGVCKFSQTSTSPLSRK